MTPGSPPANPSDHLIAPEDVTGWLADSAVKVTTIHHTIAATAQSIREHGARVEQASLDAAWGQGFYSSTVGDPRYGDAAVRVAVKLVRPLILRDPIAGAEVVDDLLRLAHTENIRDAVIAAGYDGVVVHFGQEEQWVVAFWNEQVKVLQES